MTTLISGKHINISGLIVPALVALALGGSVIIGLLLMPRFGDIVLYGLLGVVAAVLVMVYPALGVSVLATTLLVQNILIFNGRGAGATTGVKLLGMAVFAAWIAGKILRKQSFKPLLNAKMLIPSFIYTVVVFGSILWSVDTQSHVVSTLSLVQLAALSLLVYDVIDSWGKFEQIVGCLIVSGLIASTLTISQINTGVARAGEDVGGDINDTAAMLTFLLPLAFGLVRVAKSYLWRLVSLVYIVAGVLAIIFTYSRTSYVGIVIILIIEGLLMFRARPADRIKILFSCILLGGFLAYSGIVPWDKVLERSSTINPSLSEDSQAGRVRLWNAAILMFLDHPLLGVGYENYGYQFMVTYQFRIEGMEKVYGKRAHHSTVYGLMGELGSVGIGVWTWLNLTSVGNLLYVTKRQEEYSQVLAQSVLIAIVTTMIYGFVSVVDSQKLLWVMFGLSDAARRIVVQYLQESGQLVNPRRLLPPIVPFGRQHEKPL